MGYDVTTAEVTEALRALEFSIAPGRSRRDMSVGIPTWRGDIQEEADLVEEVARVLGYERIQGTTPHGPLPEELGDPWFARQEAVRDIMVGAGCREIVTYPLTSREATLGILADPSDVAPLLVGAVECAAQNGSAPSPFPEHIAPDDMPAVRLVNALSTRFEMLRLSLLPGLIETLSENARQGAASARLFEIGRRTIATPGMHAGKDLPIERRTLGAIVYGAIGDEWLNAQRPHDFADIKAVMEMVLAHLHITGARYVSAEHPAFHPGQCAQVLLPASAAPDAPLQVAGVVGQIHPEVAKRQNLTSRAFALEVDLERLYAAAPARLAARPISRFPALTRDLAIVVRRDIPAADVAATIREAGGDLAQSVTLFDRYEGAQVLPDEISLAFTIVYQAPDRTLSDADGDAERARVVALLQSRFEARLRE